MMMELHVLMDPVVPPIFRLIRLQSTESVQTLLLSTVAGGSRSTQLVQCMHCSRSQHLDKVCIDKLE